MSKIGKICFILIGLFLLGIAVFRLVLGFFHEMLFVPLALSAALFIVALIVDIRLYKDFFTMRTTKHGMNMGVLILLVFVLLVGVNFISLRHNKNFDVTQEGLNTISPQSRKVLASLEQDVQIIMFYRKNIDNISRIKAQFRKLVAMYEDATDKIKLEFINILTRPDLRKKFKVDKEGLAAFVVYGEKKTKLDKLDEQSLTKSIIKVTRKGTKNIYFVSGHGEREWSATGEQQDEGISDLKDELIDASYSVKELKLFETTKVPEDAEVVAIVGPQQPYLEPELQALRDFARKGGKLFIALDPGQRHNLALLTKSFGVEFSNNFILDQIGQMISSSPATALGVEYSKDSDITKEFPSMMTMFHVSSAIKKSDTPPAGVEVTEAVRTGPTSFVTNSLEGKPKVTKESRGPHLLVASVKSTNAATAKDDKQEGNTPGGFHKDFQAVIIGDSDFLSNQFLFQHLNRDLVLNSMAMLTRETDLISIRPKTRAGTSLAMTENQFLILIFTLILPLPLLLFGSGTFIWYRRRNA